MDVLIIVVLIICLVYTSPTDFPNGQKQQKVPYYFVSYCIH